MSYLFMLMKALSLVEWKNFALNLVCNEYMIFSDAAFLFRMCSCALILEVTLPYYVENRLEYMYWILDN